MFQAFYIVFTREILDLGSPNTGEGQDVIQTENFNSIVKMLALSLGIFLNVFYVFSLMYIKCNKT